MLKATLIPGLWRPSSETWGAAQAWGRGRFPLQAPTSANPITSNSVIIPEKLDSFINKFAEYTHEKWAFDKVGTRVPQSQECPSLKTPAFPQAQVFPEAPDLPETSSLP